VTTDAELPDAQGDRLVQSTTALLISSGTGLVLGLGFWAVAARLFSAVDVGYGVTEVTAMVLLASISQLNLGIIFPRFLYAAGAKSGTLLRLGYLSSMAAALVAATIFLVIWHHNYIAPGTFPAVFFVVAVVLWVVFSIQDAALIGLRATFWVPVENTSFSFAKILLLPLFVAVVPRDGVFLSWVLPVVLCIAGISYYLFGRVLPAHLRWSAGRASLPSRRAVGSVLAGEYAAGLAYIALQQMPALLVAARLGVKQAAYFQTPWLAGTTFDFMLYYVATALISESSARPGAAPAVVKRAVRFTALMVVPGSAVLILGARYLLLIPGSAYSHHGTTLLRYLALAMPFMGINVLYITFARLGRRVRRIVGLPASVSAIVLVLSAVLLPRLGITAVGVSFLAGQGAVAMIVLPSVVRQYRRPNMSPGFAPSAPLVAKGMLSVVGAGGGLDAGADVVLGAEGRGEVPRPRWQTGLGLRIRLPGRRAPGGADDANHVEP
jgi:O-antigen/teichoic acid export membrane protein